MGKLTISMAIFNSFLYVYQAGQFWGWSDAQDDAIVQGAEWLQLGCPDRHGHGRHPWDPLGDQDLQQISGSWFQSGGLAHNNE